MEAAILLVEDDGALREGLCELLAREGYRTKSAATAREADALIQAGSFDLCLMDVGLPDGDGVSLCRRWRAEGRNFPMIFLTALDEEIHVVRALDAGGSDYVAKPFRTMELLSRVRAQLRAHAAQQFHRAERLGHVIAAARVQRAHHVDFLIQRGEKYHGKISPFRAPTAAQGNPVAVRQAHVHQAQIKRPGLDERVRLPRGGRALCAIALPRKQFAKPLAQRAIVFHQQNGRFHGRALLSLIAPNPYPLYHKSAARKAVLRNCKKGKNEHSFSKPIIHFLKALRCAGVLAVPHLSSESTGRRFSRRQKRPRRSSPGPFRWPPYRYSLSHTALHRFLWKAMP